MDALAISREWYKLSGGCLPRVLILAKPRTGRQDWPINWSVSSCKGAVAFTVIPPLLLMVSLESVSMGCVFNPSVHTSACAHPEPGFTGEPKHPCPIRTIPYSFPSLLVPAHPILLHPRWTRTGGQISAGGLREVLSWGPSIADREEHASCTMLMKMIGVAITTGRRRMIPLSVSAPSTSSEQWAVNSGKDVNGIGWYWVLGIGYWGLGIGDWVLGGGRQVPIYKLVQCSALHCTARCSLLTPDSYCSLPTTCQSPVAHIPLPISTAHTHCPYPLPTNRCPRLTAY